MRRVVLEHNGESVDEEEAKAVMGMAAFPERGFVVLGNGVVLPFVELYDASGRQIDPQYASFAHAGQCLLPSGLPLVIVFENMPRHTFH